MRTLFVLTAVVLLTPFAQARVWTSVYRCDEATPLAPVDANHPTVYRDIMVGTRLVIVVSSDTNQFWSGALRVSWDDANEATLSARGFDQESWNYKGSCLEAAGKDAVVLDTVDVNGFGFWYNNDDQTAVAGDWFVFDYYGAQVGSVMIEMSDIDSNSIVPMETLSFTHVESRDFTADGFVNFEDFALLAKTWRLAGVPDANSPEIRFDLDADSRTNTNDLALFAEYWLERTDCNEPAAGSPTDSPAAH